jgi:hypothetical protein
MKSSISLSAAWLFTLKFFDPEGVEFALSGAKR